VTRELPSAARLLGYAGLLPQIAAVLAAPDEDTRFIALAAGYFYAALILSFLGGVWWGVAVTRDDAPAGLFTVAVVPSLVAFASGIPWMIGTPWPGPSLIALGFSLIAALIVDRWLYRRGLIGEGLWRLRRTLSLGLGSLTILLGVL
jgi:hypothetical protein